MSYRMIVCGGRDYADRAFVFETLDAVVANGAEVHIIQGGAEGADALAREWAQDRCVPFTTFPANWRKFGKRAGPIRNENMLAESDPHVVVAFPGGKGTADMIRRSVAVGVPVEQPHKP